MDKRCTIRDVRSQMARIAQHPVLRDRGLGLGLNLASELGYCVCLVDVGAPRRPGRKIAYGQTASEAMRELAAFEEGLDVASRPVVPKEGV